MSVPSIKLVKVRNQNPGGHTGDVAGCKNGILAAGAGY
jgi:hypothetical protein